MLEKNCAFVKILIRAMATALLPFSLFGCVQGEGTESVENNNGNSHLLTMTSGVSDACAGAGGVYHTEINSDGKSSAIYYIDGESLREVPLCSSAGCKHDDDTCTAYISDSTPYIFASENGGQVFIIHKVFTDSGFATLISSMDDNGRNRKEIYRLNNGESFSYPGVIAQYNDVIYILKDVYADGDMKEVLARIDCKNNISADVSEFPGNSRIIGADNENLYVCTEHIVGENQTIITKLNISSKEQSETIILNSGDHSYFYNDGNVYRIEGTDEFNVEKINLDDGSYETVYTNPDYKSTWSFSVMQSADDYIIASYMDSNFKIRHLAYDIKNGGIKDLTLKITGDDQREAFVTILACTDDYYYAAMKSEVKEILFMGTDGSYYTGNYTILKKRFINKADYFNNTENYILVKEY